MHTSDPFDSPAAPAAPSARAARSAATSGSSASSAPATAVLREARRLHRAATGDALAASLPVLRRLLASGVLQGTTLPALFGRRAQVQRKHVLRMLAREAGFDSWESWCPVLDAARASALMQEQALRRDNGTLHLWFRSEAQAHAFAAEHGGTPVRVGAHAVVTSAQPVSTA